MWKELGIFAQPAGLVFTEFSVKFGTGIDISEISGYVHTVNISDFVTEKGEELLVKGKG